MEDRLGVIRQALELLTVSGRRNVEILLGVMQSIDDLIEDCREVENNVSD